ncbi:MAG TPA: glycosyltransferase [Acidobacteriaceae bacterium]|nr:glycosyltransferase [Acidobacteriaceae bacterium]
MKASAQVHAIHTIGSLHAKHGGPSRSVVALCHALRASDVEIDLIALRSADREPLESVSSDGVHLHFPVGHTSYVAGLLRGEQAFRRAITDASHRCADLPKVLHDHGLWRPTNHAAAASALSEALPRLVSPRGMISRWALDYRRWKKRVAWALFQAGDLHSASAIHATSQLEAQEARNLGLRQPLAIVPNGVDCPPLPQSRTRNNSERRALFLSRIHPKKGLLNLVAAWARVRPQGWILEIAGTDDEGHRAAVEAEVQRQGVSGSVRFVGPVADEAKWPLYWDSDLFVLPTFSENFGMVVAEAMGAGLPVITTTGAPWAVLRERNCGWWIDLGVEPLVDAIRTATSMRDQDRELLGRRARDYVIEQLSWESVADRMVSVYRWMSAGDDQPADVVLD